MALAQESGHPLRGTPMEECSERRLAVELSYHEVYTMNKTEARRQLMQTYLKTGSLAQTTHLWQTSRQMVRKWVRRFQREGEAGLTDRSRRPHSCSRKTKPALEEKIM